MKDMAKHPRLMKRNGTYYHRASIPEDIKATYPKSEETFSLRTKDYNEAVKLLRIKSAEVDTRFEAHRAKMSAPILTELSPETVSHLSDLYYQHLLEEDGAYRIENAQEHGKGYDNQDDSAFDERTETLKAMIDSLRHDMARNKVCAHIEFEVDELLAWDNVAIRLEKGSVGWFTLAAAIQAATIRGYEALLARQRGEDIQKPLPPQKALSVASMAPQSAPLLHVKLLLSDAVKEWEKAKEASGKRKNCIFLVFTTFPNIQ